MRVYVKEISLHVMDSLHASNMQPVCICVEHATSLRRLQLPLMMGKPYKRNGET